MTLFPQHRRHGPADQQAYKREILPRLANVTLLQLGAVTGLSKTTCSQIRRRLKVPHPQHWEGLSQLGTAKGGGSTPKQDNLVDAKEPD